MINDRTIANTSGDSLDLSNYKKRGIVCVAATPYNGDKAGFAVRSPIIVIYRIAPSLELNTPDRKLKAEGRPFVLQLSSFHPETEQITFSLESPLIEVMTIDNNTGKITWIIQPGQEGILPIGTSVNDTDGTGVTRIFNINVGKPPRPTSEN